MKKFKMRILNAMIRILILAMCVFCVMPIIITISSSFMSQREMAHSFYLIPKDFSLWQIEEILLKTPQYLIWYWNSVWIAGFTLLLAIPISFLAGWFHNI